MTARKGPQIPTDSRQVMRGLDGEGRPLFGQVGVEELNYKGRFGALAISSTQNTVSVGAHSFVIDDDDNKFRVGDDLLMTSLDDPAAFMWGEITQKASGPTLLTVYVDDISQAGNVSSSNWELQVIARPKIGITKDTSATAIDPTGSGPFTFTVTAGKFFPIGGKVLMIPIADRTIALVGKVRAYSGTSLVLDKNSTNATVAQSYSSWAIALLDAPQDKIPYYQINGLRVSTNAADPISRIDIQAGSVRDYTDSVDLVLTANLTKRLDALWAAGTNQGAVTQSAPLAGTVSSAGLTVTGTGTSFTSHFGSGANGAKNNDLYNQGGVLWGVTPPPFNESIISVGSVSVPIDQIGSNTSLQTYANLGAGVGSVFRRGGPVDNALGGIVSYQYAVCLGRRDSDGLIDVFASAYTGDGSVDLPSGFTYYRALADVSVFPASNQNIEMFLKAINASKAAEIGLSHSIAFSGGASGADDVESALMGLDNATVNATTERSGLVELATDTEMEAAGDSERVVTPARQHRHPSAAKFWIEANTSGGISASYNVASITDTGVGQVTITIAANFSTTTWAAVASGQQSATQAIAVQVISQGVGVLGLRSWRLAGGAAEDFDPISWFAAGFGDQ